MAAEPRRARGRVGAGRRGGAGKAGLGQAKPGLRHILASDLSEPMPRVHDDIHPSPSCHHIISHALPTVTHVVPLPQGTLEPIMTAGASDFYFGMRQGVLVNLAADGTVTVLRGGQAPTPNPAVSTPPAAPVASDTTRGLRWLFKPGPAHLDTLEFEIVSDSSSRSPDVVLRYTGFIDRGQVRCTRVPSDTSRRGPVSTCFITLFDTHLVLHRNLPYLIFVAAHRVPFFTQPHPHDGAGGVVAARGGARVQPLHHGPQAEVAEVFLEAASLAATLFL